MIAILLRHNVIDFKCKNHADHYSFMHIILPLFYDIQLIRKYISACVYIHIIFSNNLSIITDRNL